MGFVNDHDLGWRQFRLLGAEDSGVQSLHRGDLYRRHRSQVTLTASLDDADIKFAEPAQLVGCLRYQFITMGYEEDALETANTVGNDGGRHDRLAGTCRCDAKHPPDTCRNRFVEFVNKLDLIIEEINQA
jgi:hypothetical protein